jgi:ribosome assembly protein RRB1
MKFSKLHKTKYDDDSSVEDSEDDDVMNDEEGEVTLESVSGLKYGINRIRTLNHQPIGN